MSNKSYPYDSEWDPLRWSKYCPAMGYAKKDGADSPSWFPKGLTDKWNSAIVVHSRRGMPSRKSVGAASRLSTTRGLDASLREQNRSQRLRLLRLPSSLPQRVYRRDAS
jgi:hypothetical protein